jgi:hypothetical protein
MKWVKPCELENYYFAPADIPFTKKLREELLMMPGDVVLHTTPSGKSSTIRIRYNLRNR